TQEQCRPDTAKERREVCVPQRTNPKPPGERRAVGGPRLEIHCAGRFGHPAALLTGIRSDLPGQIIGQVTENVYDTPSGRYLLIPHGSKLIGVYDSQVSFGQSRVLLVWTRLIFPNGRSIAD